MRLVWRWYEFASSWGGSIVRALATKRYNNGFAQANTAGYLHPAINGVRKTMWKGSWERYLSPADAKRFLYL